MSEEIKYLDFQAIEGRYEPDLGFTNGRNLKEFFHVTHDSDGNPLLDGEVYMLTPGKITLCGPEDIP